MSDPLASSPIRVQQGQTLSVWVKFAGAADGRAYFGFGATPQTLTGQDSSNSRTLALVLAPNTNQLLFQNVAGGNHATLGTAVSATYQADHWYRAEVVWGAGTGGLIGRLYDSDGTTLLSTVTATNTTSITQGGIAFRGFSNPNNPTSAKYFDTVAVGASTDTPEDFANAGGGLPPGFVPGTPPPPLLNNPIITDYNALPTQYASMPGTGRDIQHNDIAGGPSVFATATGPDGRPWVALAAGNTSLNVGTRAVDWGPNYGGPATPLIGQWMLRQRPGERTQVIGYAADVKHFFAPSFLDPGVPDTYGASLNADQNNMTPISELDPVTGRLQRPSHVRSQNVDGVNNVTVSHSHSPLDHRLRVPIADLDPAQNPAGTRWFYMAMIFVEGDQNIDNNSRWVEIRPTVSGTSVSLSNIGPQQLNFRTIPGLSAGPRVVSQAPTGTVAGPLSSIRVTFDRAIDASTFTTADIVSLTGPAGPITPTTVTPVSGRTDQFDIIFPSQGVAGRYNFVLGPDILDTSGAAMDQNVNGIPGETPDDQYAGTFVVSAPRVTGHTPTGQTAGLISSVRVTFDRPMDASTFTTDDVVSFTGPGGAITVTGVTPVSGSTTQFDITFAGQTQAGNYSLTFGPDVRDTFGNPMDQNGDGTPGQVPGDRYTATFTIIAPRIISQTPTGTTPAPVSSIRLTFNGAIDVSTFTAADIVSFSGPNGPITVSSITPVPGTGNTQFELAFEPQDTDGVYTMVLGPDIRDTAGNPMDQDGDGIPGEVPDDQYTARFTIGFLGTDAFGYVASSTGYEDHSIVGLSGTFPIITAADDTSVQVDLGANTFRFYNTTYTGANRLFVSSNGLISFGVADSSFSYTNLTTSPTEPVIAVFWQDLITGSGSPMVVGRFEGIGDSDPGNDRLVIEWNAVQHYSSSPSTVTFQAILYLNTGSNPGAIVLNYADTIFGNPAWDNGAASSTGIKDAGAQPATGGNRLLVNFNNGSGAVVGSNKAVLISAAGVAQFRVASVSVDEGAGQATITVRRNGGTVGAVSVVYATSAGQDYTAVTGTLTFAAGQNLATFTVPILDDSLVEGNETFNITLSNPTDGLLLGTPTTAVVTIVDNDSQVLTVTNITPTSTGFSADFSQPIDPSVLNLYDGPAGALGPADVTMTDSGGNLVQGSLVISADGRHITFIRTGGLLPSGGYTLRFRSAANGFRTSDGTLLDGDRDGTPGGDYVGTFTVSSSTAVVVGIPDVVRGPDQAVNIPATSTGLPLTLSNSDGITAITLTLRYDPALLALTGITAVPAGATATLNTSTPGQALITFTSPTPLAAGVTEFVRLTASVPHGAPYKAKAVLDLTNIRINGGAIAATDDDGLQAVVYFGDASGNGSYSTLDATRILQVGLGLGTGFAALPLIDPVLIGDITGNGVINSVDATRVLQKTIGLPVPQIPDLPPELPAVMGTIDPLLRVPRRFRGRPGRLVSVPVLLDFSEGLQNGDLALTFDSSRLEVVSVARGSLTRDFDTFAVNVDNEAGSLQLGLNRSAGGLSGRGAGSLVRITFRIKAGAPAGAAVVNLRQNLGSTTTQLNEGDFVLNPAPTNAADDPVDGLVRVLAGRRLRPGSGIVPVSNGADLISLIGNKKQRGGSQSA